jgi:hypothetical protein
MIELQNVVGEAGDGLMKVHARSNAANHMRVRDPNKADEQHAESCQTRVMRLHLPR